MNWPLLQNSLLVAGITTVFSTLLGFLAALWLEGLERRWRKFILALAILSLALPAFLVTNCWLDLLGLTGTWRSWLPLNIFSLGGTIWILTLMNWPISMFFVLASWRRLEQSQLEIDPLLTGNALIKLLLFPTAKTAIIQAALLTVVLALNNFSVPTILQVKVFPAEVWVNFNTMFDYKAALQLCWPMILVPLLVLFFFRERKLFWTAKRNEISAKYFRQQLGVGWFVSGAVCCVVAIFFSAILPVSKLLLAKVTWSDFLPAFEAGKMAISHSALFAAVTAFVIVAVALFSWRWPLDIFLWLTFLVPGVLLGIFLIWIFNRGPFVALYQSIVIVIFAFALRYIAPGWNIVAHSLRTTDRNLSDAAQLEGAAGWQLFRHVQLPQIFPQLCVAWYVTYLFCLWDVETLIIIVPPGSETVALRVFNLLHYGHNSQVNALCVLLLALAVLPLVIWKCLPRRLNFLSVAILGFLFVGCSDSNKKGAERNFPVQSKFFSSVQIIGSRGTGVGQFNKPRSLALDRDDNLFVVDTTGRVQKFSPDGKFLLSWQMPQTELGKPKGMGRDSGGNVVVVEPHYMRVNHFTSDGKLVFQWGIKGTNEGQLMFPRSVATNSRGELFVSEYGLVERVQHFSRDGKTLWA